MLFTDEGIVKIGLMESLMEALSSEGIQYFVYDRTVPNPTIDNIEEALEMYQFNHCNGIIAFGGGSPIDCAAMIPTASPISTIPPVARLRP